MDAAITIIYSNLLEFPGVSKSATCATWMPGEERMMVERMHMQAGSMQVLVSGCVVPSRSPALGVRSLYYMQPVV